MRLAAVSGNRRCASTDIIETLDNDTHPPRVASHWIEHSLVVVLAALVRRKSACATERSCAWSEYLTGTSLHLW